MTEAARLYDLKRKERVRLRTERGSLSQEEEAEFGGEMDILWNEMTDEEQRAVEDSLSVPSSS